MIIIGKMVDVVLLMVDGSFDFEMVCIDLTSKKKPSKTVFG
jgi:hypothetical protein